MGENTLVEAIRRDGRYSALLLVYPDTDTIYFDLPQTRRRVVMAQLLTFLAGGQEVQVEKLLLALKYWGEGNRISSIGQPGEYVVRGNHGTYLVRLVPASCNCPIFRGTGKFAGKKGVCSHFLLALISAI